MIFSVYKITFYSGRVYIGSTKNVDNRIKQHKKFFIKEYDDDIKKYEIIKSFDNAKDCATLEDKLIKNDYLGKSYNLDKHSNYGTQLKQKTKKEFYCDRMSLEEFLTTKAEKSNFTVLNKPICEFPSTERLDLLIAIIINGEGYKL